MDCGFERENVCYTSNVCEKTSVSLCVQQDQQIQSVVREGWCVLEKVYMFFKVRESLRASETERGKRVRVCERQKTNCVFVCT